MAHKSKTCASADSQAMLLYDGECGLCGRSVRMISRRDHAGIIAYITLQSEAGQTLMRDCGIDPQQRETLVLVEGQTSYQRSDAVLRILHHLGGCWRWLGILRLIPRSLRDAAYDFVARRRHCHYSKG